MTDKLYEELVQIRHHVHQYPELSGEEYKTSEYISEILTGWGINPLPTSLNAGVIAELGEGEGEKVIALRADIDGLPVKEKTGLPYASVNEGKMHACGHDFHQTALLGAAYELKRRESELNKKVRLIFQSGEESTWGSQEVVNAGFIDDVEVIVGFHNHPAYPVGTIALKTGPIMAGVDQFKVYIKGRGSHAAEPHLGIDVPTTISALVGQLQTIVSRNISPRDTTVLSITHIEVGESWNVLPDKGFFEGTTRTFSKENRTYIKKRFYEMVKAAETAYGVKVEIEWKNGPNITYNDPTYTKEVIENCKKFANVVEAIPSNGGEDFSTYLTKAPGVFAFIGSNGDENAPGWHHTNFVVKDEALKTAVDYFVETAIELAK
jgi:amidohydrolase